jgi:hypothetical protein
MILRAPPFAEQRLEVLEIEDLEGPHWYPD